MDGDAEIIATFWDGWMLAYEAGARMLCIGWMRYLCRNGALVEETRFVQGLGVTYVQIANTELLIRCLRNIWGVEAIHALQGMKVGVHG